MAIKHAFVSAIPDGSDATLVRPSNWNDNHTIDDGTITAPKLADTAVTPGTYTQANITVDQQGRITVASTGIIKYSNSISLGDTTSVITHGLADASAILLGATPNWNAGQPFITAQDANTITVTFPNECSLAAGGKLVGGVIHS